MRGDGHGVFEPGLVIYQAGEGARGVKKRLRAWRKHFRVQFDRRTPLVLLQKPIDLYREADRGGDTDKLIAEIKRIARGFNIPLQMVIIDTLATASAGAEENSGKDMGIVLANIAKIGEATGAHVNLVHHMNAGGTKLRGHTSVYANVDQVLLVTRDPETKVRTAVLDKQKDDESGGRFQFELMLVDLGEDARGRAITSCVCLPVGAKEAIRRAEESKGYVLYGAERDFMRVFFEVENIQGQPVPPDMVAPAGVRSIVKHAAFQAELERQTPPLHVPSEDASDEEKAEANRLHTDRIKKHVKRMGEKLRGFGIVGNAKHGDTWWMWWTGKPLRGFPHTQPRERARPEPEPDPELREPDIPF